jgi:type IX secretion system PorP/SprF family membrane protein
MNRLLFFILLICTFQLTSGQSNTRMNNYWDNTYYINPAAVNSKYAAVVSVVARKQWFGVDGAPTTFFASGTTYIDNLQTQFGIKVFADEIGYTRVSNFSLSYAYSVILNSDYRLNLGVAGSYQNLSYNQDEVDALTPDDPASFTRMNKTSNYNCDLGAEIKNKTLTLGISAQNIFSSFFDENKLQNNTNFLYAKYRKMTKEPVNVGFGAAAIQYNSILQMEFNITSYFNYNKVPDFFQAGLFYRTRTEMGGILGMNLNDALHLYYSYDFNVAGIRRGNTGSHEIMLVYTFEKSPRCTTCEQ